MVLPLFLVAFLAGCGTDDTLPETGNSSVPGNSGTPSSEVELVSETTPIPDGYEQEAEQRGSIVRVDYNTRDYAEGSGAARTNTAYVYLPYGYDGQERYNIMYLVHGHYGTASTYFETENGMLRKLLDQMITHGDIDPMIVVTPTYNYLQLRPAHSQLYGCRPVLPCFAAGIGERPDSRGRKPIPYIR